MQEFPIQYLLILHNVEQNNTLAFYEVYIINEVTYTFKRSNLCDCQKCSYYKVYVHIIRYIYIKISVIIIITIYTHRKQ